MTTPARSTKHTLAEWLAQPAERRLELIDGEFIEKAAPTFEHGRAQRLAAGSIGEAYDRRPGSGRPGGWWIATEVDIELQGQGYRPDIVGWRRERLPTPPRERPVTVRPDWVCEVVSESNATIDTVKKLRRYHQAGIPHYWIIDPSTATLSVYRNSPEGFVQILSAERHECVRAEPFGALEIQVDLLFGGDPAEP